MRMPLTLIAALLAAGPALGQPAKHDAPKSAEASPRRAEVVLASADTVPAPVPPAVQTTVAPKRVAPRISHCRCGDPQPGEATPGE